MILSSINQVIVFTYEILDNAYSDRISYVESEMFLSECIFHGLISFPISGESSLSTFEKCQ